MKRWHSERGLSLPLNWSICSQKRKQKACYKGKTGAYISGQQSLWTNMTFPNKGVWVANSDHMSQLTGKSTWEWPPFWVAHLLIKESMKRYKRGQRQGLLRPTTTVTASTYIALSVLVCVLKSLICINSPNHQSTFMKELIKVAKRN